MSNQNQKNSDIKYWVAFSLLPKVGPVRLRKIMNYFSSFKHAWGASMSELINAGIEKNIAENILINRKSINPDLEMQKLEQEGIKVITIKNERYPKLLKEIYAPPILLYYKGEFSSAKDEFALAIVGTRKFSNYAQQVAPQITHELAQAGLVIVSGLALGIDALAHESCVEAGGRTIAVLGSGLDKQSIYPSYNRHLADKILANGGLLLSEFPIGTQPLKHNFPQRNRIVAGLSLGSLIIEAPEKSGALITARYSLEENREVFAVPGSIYNKNSFGSNNLIKQGAKMVTCAKDVLEALDLSLVKNFVETKQISPDSPEEEKVLEYLSHDPLHVDNLVKQTGLDIKTLNSTLTLMEMKGKIKNLGGMMYVVSR